MRINLHRDYNRNSICFIPNIQIKLGRYHGIKSEWKHFFSFSFTWIKWWFVIQFI
jgi:hypothetical protein